MRDWRVWAFLPSVIQRTHSLRWVKDVERNEEPPAHRGHRAAVGVAAKGDPHGWPRARVQSLDYLIGHGDAGGCLATQLDLGAEHHWLSVAGRA